MSPEPAPDDNFNDLRDVAQVEERPFTSNVPVLGPFIVWFRSSWNSVATRWFVRPLMAQQNTFNKAVVDHLDNMDEQRSDAESLLDQLEARLAAQDREQTDLTHDIAELTARVNQLRRELASLQEDPTSGVDESWS